MEPCLQNQDAGRELLERTTAEELAQTQASSPTWQIRPLFKITTHRIEPYRPREDYIKVAESVMFSALKIEQKSHPPQKTHTIMNDWMQITKHA